MLHRARTVQAAALIAASTLTLTACVGGGGGGGASAGGDSDDTTLTIWHYESEDSAMGQAWAKAIEIFEDEHPDVTVDVEKQTFEQIQKNAKIVLTGDDVPDVMEYNKGNATAGQLAAQGLIAPLTDAAEEHGWADKLSGSLQTTARYDDKGLMGSGDWYGVPNYGEFVGVYYNKDMFAKAGVPEPKAGWTTDDFLAAAKKLTTGGKYGFAAFPVIDWTLPFATSIFGVNPVTPDGKLDLTNAKFVEAMQWYADLVQKQKVAPSIPASNDATWPVNQFLSGNTAMAVDGPWDLINAKAQAKFDLGIAPVPAGPNGSRTVTAGSGFGISRNCKFPDQTMKAISVITGPEAQQYLGEQGRAFPARTAQQQFWYKNAVPGAQEALEKASEGSEPYRTTTKWNQVSQLFMQYGIEAINGQQPVQTWLQNVQQQAG